MRVKQLRLLHSAADAADGARVAAAARGTTRRPEKKLLIERRTESMG
jgi:hypothetical protein